jgi:hypothetical protein
VELCGAAAVKVERKRAIKKARLKGGRDVARIFIDRISRYWKETSLTKYSTEVLGECSTLDETDYYMLKKPTYRTTYLSSNPVIETITARCHMKSGGSQ